MTSTDALPMTVSRLKPLCPECESYNEWTCCQDSRHREYVYFAHIGDYVKVGTSTRPDTRVRSEIQGPYGSGCATPRFRAHEAEWFIPRREPLHLLHVVEAKGGRTWEGRAHDALWDFGEVGEWFIAEPALLAWIVQQEAGKPFERLTREGGEWLRPKNEVEVAEFAHLQAIMRDFTLGDFIASRLPQSAASPTSPGG